MLYKYRSLENFKYFVDIILNNRLYASSFKDLNDPMEGMYYLLTKDCEKTITDKLKEDKGKFKICSLSKLNNDELMWSHYADGHKGVVLGVKIDKAKYDIQSIEYAGIPTIHSDDLSHLTAKEILCRKLEAWNYEQEERVFVRNTRFVQVYIVEVITGRRMSEMDLKFITLLIHRINSTIQMRKAESIMNK